MKIFNFHHTWKGAKVATFQKLLKTSKAELLTNKYRKRERLKAENAAFQLKKRLTLASWCVGGKDEGLNATSLKGDEYLIFSTSTTSGFRELHPRSLPGVVVLLSTPLGAVGDVGDAVRTVWIIKRWNSVFFSMYYGGVVELCGVKKNRILRDLFCALGLILCFFFKLRNKLNNLTNDFTRVLMIYFQYLFYTE